MKIPHARKTTFTTFDKTISITTFHQRPDRIRMLEEKITCPQIPRGAGLSYAPVSFGQDILVKEITSFNRILEFDEKQKTVVVEAGISLKKLLEWSYQEKLFFPVLPGHPDITIGGCIAGNVHGKNPSKDGSFKEHVIWIELFHPKNGTRIIEPKSELFDVTCGGLGLTGIITKVKLQLYDLPSDRIIIEPKKVDSLIEAVEVFEKQSNADVLYSWHSGSVFKNFGKGVVTVGAFAKGFHNNKLKIPKTASVKKINIPVSFWGKTSTAVFFSIFRNMELREEKIEKNIFNVFFPLTGIAQWFHVLYGKRGFREYQILVSKNNVPDFIRELTNLVNKEKPDLNIISLKPFKGNQRYIQFCRDGLSIVLEFPNSISTNQFISKIDELVISYNAIPNIIKNSILSKKVVEKCFPEYNEFRNILNRNDPDRVFRSHVSQQLGL
jgi:decaprenylphospho-beta-D-ribofuranose 2-oxidase